MKNSEKIIINVVRLTMLCVGLAVGYIVSFPLFSLMRSMDVGILADQSYGFIVMVGILMVLCGLIGFVIGKPLADLIVRGTTLLEQRLKQMPFPALISSTIGLIVGLLIAALLASTVKQLPVIGTYMPVVLSVLFGYLGLSVGYRWRETVDGFMGAFKRTSRRSRKDAKDGKDDKGEAALPEALAYKTVTHPKVLDTSVIIDGRIVEICKAGFLEGPLVITNFVLDELRHIADSGDSLKRVRGRRGLDILNELRGTDVEVINVSIDYEDIPEVDAKLVQLAKDCNGYVVTNDFNLNKVASFQKVKTLNVNELAGAIKTVVLPGEHMRVEVVARGKENDQGVGYLDDGTMVVVENGKHVIGKTVDTTVTSVIQTNAGRMIFVRLA